MSVVLELLLVIHKRLSLWLRVSGEEGVVTIVSLDVKVVLQRLTGDFERLFFKSLVDAEVVLYILNDDVLATVSRWPCGALDLEHVQSNSRVSGIRLFSNHVLIIVCSIAINLCRDKDHLNFLSQIVEGFCCICKAVIFDNHIAIIRLTSKSYLLLLNIVIFKELYSSKLFKPLPLQLGFSESCNLDYL